MKKILTQIGLYANLVMITLASFIYKTRLVYAEEETPADKINQVVDESTNTFIEIIENAIKNAQLVGNIMFVIVGIILFVLSLVYKSKKTMFLGLIVIDLLVVVVFNIYIEAFA